MILPSIRLPNTEREASKRMKKSENGTQSNVGECSLVIEFNLHLWSHFPRSKIARNISQLNFKWQFWDNFPFFHFDDGYISFASHTIHFTHFNKNWSKNIYLRLIEFHDTSRTIWFLMREEQSNDFFLHFTFFWMGEGKEKNI